MKLLIASDIHGSAYWCSKLMDAYQNEKAATVFFALEEIVMQT